LRRLQEDRAAADRCRLTSIILKIGLRLSVVAVAQNLMLQSWRDGTPGLVPELWVQICEWSSTSVIATKENPMNTRTFILASIALLGAGLDSAISSPCTVEIDGLTKTLAAKDAGSGPTIGATGQTGTGMGSLNQDQHPPTAVMGRETQGKATSPEDVGRQNQGRPTAAQQGTTGRATATDKIDEAGQALERARALDAQGKETECMETVRQAKELAPRK
jgi:hypothetical protein